MSALRSHQRECGIGAVCSICHRKVTQKRNLGKHMEKHKREEFLQQHNAKLNILNH